MGQLMGQLLYLFKKVDTRGQFKFDTITIKG